MRKVTLTLLALALGTATVPAQGWADKMFKGQVTHNFGTVPRGAQLIHRFTITNIYAVQMEITDVKSGCGCVTATPLKRVLQPRDSTVIEVRMDAARFTGPKTVGVRVNVGPQFVSSAELRVTANSRADVVFNPGQVSFGSVTKGQTPTKTMDVEYAGKLAWQISSASTSKDAPLSASVKEMYRRPGQVGYRLTVSLKKDAPMGVMKETIFLKTNDPTTPLVSVLVEANVQSAITVSPTFFTLGTVKTGTTLTRRVVVRGDRAFRITKVDGLGSGVELGAPLAITDETVQFLTIKCKPGKDGKFKHELKIRTTLQDTPVIVTVDGSAAK